MCCNFVGMKYNQFKGRQHFFGGGKTKIFSPRVYLKFLLIFCNGTTTWICYTIIQNELQYMNFNLNYLCISTFLFGVHIKWNADFPLLHFLKKSISSSELPIFICLQFAWNGLEYEMVSIQMVFLYDNGHSSFSLPE